MILFNLPIYIDAQNIADCRLVNSFPRVHSTPSNASYYILDAGFATRDVTTGSSVLKEQHY